MEVDTGLVGLAQIHRIFTITRIHTGKWVTYVETRELVHSSADPSRPMPPAAHGLPPDLQGCAVNITPTCIKVKMNP